MEDMNSFVRKMVGKLLGADEQRTSPYVQAGINLTHWLVGSLGLKGWERDSRGLLVPTYAPPEVRAIQTRLSGLQSMADDLAAGEARYRPEVANEVQRWFIAEALHDLAGCSWKYDGRPASEKTRLSEDWRERISTYLKAWACGLDPRVLLDMAALLANAGYKGEAGQALQVVLLSPSYAEELWGSAAPDMISGIIDDAHKALRNL
jgi:hypothetical protein